MKILVFSTKIVYFNNQCSLVKKAIWGGGNFAPRTWFLVIFLKSQATWMLKINVFINFLDKNLRILKKFTCDLGSWTATILIAIEVYKYLICALFFNLIIFKIIHHVCISLPSVAILFMITRWLIIFSFVCTVGKMK